MEETIENRVLACRIQWVWYGENLYGYREPFKQGTLETIRGSVTSWASPNCFRHTTTPHTISALIDPQLMRSVCVRNSLHHHSTSCLKRSQMGSATLGKRRNHSTKRVRRTGPSIKGRARIDKMSAGGFGAGAVLDLCSDWEWTLIGGTCIMLKELYASLQATWKRGCANSASAKVESTHAWSRYHQELARVGLAMSEKETVN